jgi:hypothetical protein
MVSIQVTMAQVLGNHVEYTLEVTHPTEGQWKFQRRYSVLRGWHALLGRAVYTSLPAFPPKKLFGNMKPEFIHKRHLMLQKYYDCLVNLSPVTTSNEFNSLIRPADKLIIKTNSSVPSQASSPPRSPSSPEKQEMLDRKYKRLVEEVAVQLISLNSNPNPLENEDTQRRHDEYDKLMLTFPQVKWGLTPLKSVDISSLNIDQSVFPWLQSQAKDMHRVCHSCHVPDIPILR